jgi:hypothetical protein
VPYISPSASERSNITSSSECPSTQEIDSQELDLAITKNKQISTQLQESIEAPTVEETEKETDKSKKRKLLPPCKYGAKCYRKNPQHFMEFHHDVASK